MTSIAEQRRAEAEVGLVMRRREQWGATFNYTNSRPVDEPATLLVAHIAVVNDPGDLVGTEDQVMRLIERIGISRFPATGYSYNAAVFDSGRIYEGQPVGRRGAHTANTRQRSTCSQSGCPSQGDSLTAPSWNNNVNARAVVAPQMPGDPCTDAQVDGFARVGAGWKLAGFVSRDARWHGHRCFAAKDCPSARVWARLDDIADLTADYLREGLDDMATPEEIAAAVWRAEHVDPITQAKTPMVTIVERIRKDANTAANPDIEAAADAIVARLDGTADAATIRTVVREELGKLQLILHSA